MLVNGRYPGPAIVADWGDWLEITVYNRLTNKNGTAIHWHGIQQIGTNRMDGTPGAVQCPIPPGGKMTYRWRATQYGTSWYHSHFALQYTNGVVGPLIINGPTSANYDNEYTLMLSDWFHRDAFALFYGAIFGPNPAPDTKLLNGRWKFPCSATDPKCVPSAGAYSEFQFQRGKKYKLRLINPSTSNTMSFWIDGHSNFTVVAVDFVPVEPFQVSSINLAIAQRCDIIVEANADISQQTNFWIRMTRCGVESCPLPGDFDHTRAGIIRYDFRSREDPPPTPPSCPNFGACLDLPFQLIKPIVRKQVPPPPPDLLHEFYPAFGSWPNDSVPFAQSAGHRWNLGKSTFQIDWQKPSLTHLGLESKYGIPKEPFPPSYQVMNLATQGQWTYFVIVANFVSTDPAKLAIPINHPIHLHGHDFSVLAQVTGQTYNPNSPPEFSLENPARRDTAMLPGSGFLVIGFETKNPGAWLLHCHIAFHASAGFAIQILELPDQILSTEYPDTGAGDFERKEYRDQCQAWRASWKKSPWRPDFDKVPESGAKV
ncbi:hypothetical protein DRE_01138 [Drechslerella stenobrocha 248]|uniref:Laccase-2 n=1 Tax=Drechslerella stenobrocha 248 TaxID=1043628 RepID=W7HW66_9PEZI|nr:hypothetical protein DRE_01138 [Drechslerella stenobrocha 248]